MTPTQPIPFLDALNAGLSTAVPTIGLFFAAFNLVREQFRRHAAGEPEMTVAEKAAFMVGAGGRISATAKDWLVANGYDERGNKIV